jgi:LmbE family N-acetylglucosaminyl deacetylase
MKTNVRKILAIGAHPDDLEISCAGSLAKWAKEGSLITMVVVSNGELSSPDAALSGKMGKIRGEEFINSAAIIKARKLRLNMEDGLIFDDKSSRLVFIKLIKEVRPDIVITHYPKDDHPDHRAVNSLVCSSIVIAQAESPDPNWRVKKVYFMDSLGSINFYPDTYIDISETVSIKKQMLLSHLSQFKVMKKKYKIDLWDVVEATARFRGIQANVKYAEAFVEFRSWRRSGVIDES